MLGFVAAYNVILLNIYFNQSQHCTVLHLTYCSVVVKVVQKKRLHQGPDLQKYLTTILQLPYDNAKLTIDLR